MVFNSLTFALFFAGVLAIHNLPLGWTTKKINLLIASYLFYAAWNPPFVILLWVSTVVDWWAAKALVRSERPAARRAWMMLSVVANLGMLGFFKYGQFLLDNFTALLHMLGIPYQPPHYAIVLPVGISFYTFATMSYTLDVYLRRALPARNFLDYALFVTFFPHLVAGPIMRPTELVPQFEHQRRVSSEQLCFGLALMTLGLFQKVVLPGPNRRACLRRRCDSGCARRMGGNTRLRRADLLRLRRILDYRDRGGDVPWLRHAGQFPFSVCRDRLLGFLATLAHHTLRVAARLSVHSARR